MKKIAFISDLIFTFFVSFVCSTLFFRHLRLGLWSAIVLAVLCGLLVVFSVGAYLYSKRTNVFMKKSEAAQREKFILHLALSGNEANAELFKTLLLSQNPAAQIKRTGKNRLTSADTVYFLLFTFSPVTADDVAPFTRLKTRRKKFLFCNKADETARDICGRFAIEIKTSDELFDELNTAGRLPTTFLGDTPTNATTKRKWKLWLSKSNSRRFLLSATLILFLARLTPFYYYYLGFGILLLFAAIFTRIFGKE
jgi:hypothetical protein